MINNGLKRVVVEINAPKSQSSNWSLLVDKLLGFRDVGNCRNGCED